MNKFIVLYRAPLSVLEEWSKTDPEVRKETEKKMQTDWQTWMGAHAQSVEETVGAGKTKRVTKNGVEDSKNDVMLYSIVEADSHEEAAKMFEGHPHLGIPEASIEVMAANPLKGM